MAAKIHLTPEEKIFVITRLAAFHSQVSLRMQFKQKFGRELCRQTVSGYAMRVRDREDLSEELLALYDDTRKKILQKFQNDAILPKSGRVLQKQRRCEMLDTIAAARAESMADVPGGETGLLTRHPRSTKEDPIYVLDDHMLRELRELENDTARELGEFDPHIDLDRLDHASFMRIVTAERQRKGWPEPLPGDSVYTGNPDRGQPCADKPYLSVT